RTPPRSPFPYDVPWKAQRTQRKRRRQERIETWASAHSFLSSLFFLCVLCAFARTSFLAGRSASVDREVPNELGLAGLLPLFDGLLRLLLVRGRSRQHPAGPATADVHLVLGRLGADGVPQAGPAGHFTADLSLGAELLGRGAGLPHRQVGAAQLPAP